MPEDDNAAAAHRVQVRFEFYLLALNFTVLGLSVQTANFGASVVADAIELFSWVALLLSGIFGLWRLEWSPIVYYVYSRRDRSSEIARRTRRRISSVAREAPISGEDRTISLDDELARKHEDAISRFDEELDGLQNRQSKKYRVQRMALLLGMVGLVLARGLPAFVGLFGFSLR